MLNIPAEYFCVMCALFVTDNLCGIIEVSKRVLLVVFFWTKMLGLVNSGLYCYFSSLIQLLSNSSNVQRLLQEHATAIESGDSKFDSYHPNILEKYATEKFTENIHYKYSIDLDLVTNFNCHCF